MKEAHKTKDKKVVVKTHSGKILLVATAEGTKTKS